MAYNYPKGMMKQSATKKVTPKPIEYGKRGMNFEDMINESNQYYLTHNQAIIHKKPTPIQIVKVDYPKRSAAKITEAYFRHASTTDYNGVCRGYYLDFEAKETKNKTSFPLSNFHEHQIMHMHQCSMQGGLCFVLLWFSSLKRCFYLDFATLHSFWQNKHQKKSIPLAEIEQLGYECQLGIAPKIDFLPPIYQLIDQKGAHHFD